MQAQETVVDFLVRRLKEQGASRFEEIAEKTGVKASFIRKFVYGSRENPRVQTIQPLIDYFTAEDKKGRRSLTRQAAVEVTHG